ncbi:virion structural protein [Pseudomonas phage PhiPA3]|uniref:Virion structural protein n=1 Tax=Pseudomonas phage PhiPA3 TaxID=998086 RepID=F8SK35_BPPA3|nr:virion structural protein [Pseudomonas phage PhiPA3]AEH03585.1 virion structural protein [Pseudomonas phage PhiPA3]
MSDRFPYNLPSREALVRLIRETSKHTGIQSDYVSFEDLFYSPTAQVPGRTYIEMEDHIGAVKDWFVFRRLDMATVLGNNTILQLTEAPTPAAVATEINRSRNMQFGPDDLSFSTDVIPHSENEFIYTVRAMTGSYAYYGSVDVTIRLVGGSPYARVLEDGTFRYTEDGNLRELEH